MTLFGGCLPRGALRVIRRFGVLLGALALSACALPAPQTGPDAPPGPKSSFSDLSGWSTADTAAALASFVVSCKALALMPPDTSLGGSGLAKERGGQAGLWTASCAAAKAVAPDDQDAARQFFQSWFDVYRVSGAATLTGYFEPEVAGAKNDEPGARVPLYAKPAVTALADLTRAQIDNGALQRKTPVTAYVSNPVDAYMLQVQGAGRIVLPNGRILSVGFDGDNGQPYTPIGSILVQMGALSAGNLSYQSISGWLKAHPDQAQSIMEQNANYAYLLPLGYLPANEGPPGALGVPLSAGHSLAVDRTALPLGAPVFVETTNPVTAQPMDILAVAQDTGAGLAGADEADIFFGAGAEAEQIAGAMHQAGTMYLLLPRATPASP